MLMETRQQNTEIRVSLSKVTDKMDRMWERLDQLHGQQSSALMLSNSVPSMEVGMLVHSIERIVKVRRLLARFACLSLSHAFSLMKANLVIESLCPIKLHPVQKYMQRLNAYISYMDYMIFVIFDSHVLARREMCVPNLEQFSSPNSAIWRFEWEKKMIPSLR